MDKMALYIKHILNFFDRKLIKIINITFFSTIPPKNGKSPKPLPSLRDASEVVEKKV